MLHCEGPGQSVEWGWGSSLRCITNTEKFDTENILSEFNPTHARI